MLTNHHRRAVGIFPTREMAGQAIDKLMFCGFPLAQVFLVGKDEITSISEDSAQPLEFPTPGISDTATGTATGMQKGLFLGNLLGGVTGLFLGMGILALCGGSQIALSCVFWTYRSSEAIAFTLLSGAIGTAAGGVIGGLIGLGLTCKDGTEYSKPNGKANFFVIIEGTQQEVVLAQRMLNGQAKTCWVDH
ncbi:MAG: hypothetical protein VKL59_05840 [Nostocaceae cyanobacterium]|nr:hypothetical protein [Nostocaceae cyanobacterium]